MQALFRPRPKRFFNYEKHKISCLYLEPYVVISLLVVSVGGNMERRRLAGIAVRFHHNKQAPPKKNLKKGVQFPKVEAVQKGFRVQV